MAAIIETRKYIRAEASSPSLLPILYCPDPPNSICPPKVQIQQLRYKPANKHQTLRGSTGRSSQARLIILPPSFERSTLYSWHVRDVHTRLWLLPSSTVSYANVCISIFLYMVLCCFSNGRKLRVQVPRRPWIIHF
jgi:hypothetical protein